MKFSKLNFTVAFQLIRKIWDVPFEKGGGGGHTPPHTFPDYEKNTLMIVRKFSYLGDKRRPFVKNFNSKIK